MAADKKRGLGLYVNAVAVVLAIAGIVAAVMCSTMSADYALGSLGLYIAGVVASIALVCLSVWSASRAEDNGSISTIAIAVAVFVLAFVAISMIGARVLLASGLFTWNSGNAIGWSVFYTTVVAAVLLIASAVVLVVGAFMPTFKKVQA